MLRRVTVAIGRGFRETGQAIERMGMRAQDNWIFQEKLCRHRAVMNLFDQRPKLGAAVFVAPNASVIGSVEVKECSTIWYGAVVRGDQSSIYVGAYSSIGDRTVVQSSAINPTGFSARTYVPPVPTSFPAFLLTSPPSYRAPPTVAASPETFRFHETGGPCLQASKFCFEGLETDCEQGIESRKCATALGLILCRSLRCLE